MVVAAVIIRASHVPVRPDATACANV